MADRPTPRDGWTAVPKISDDAVEAPAPPVLKPAPSTVDATVSLTNLRAIAPAAQTRPEAPAESKRDMTVDYATHGLAPVEKAQTQRDMTVDYATHRLAPAEKAEPAQSKRDMTVDYTKQPVAPAGKAAAAKSKPAASADAARRRFAPPAKAAQPKANEAPVKAKPAVRPATKTLLGQPAPKLLKEPLAAPPGEASAPQPVQVRNTERSVTSKPPPPQGSRDTDTTHDLSSSDVSVTDVRRAREADKTEELSLSNISLAELSPPDKPSAREADKTEELSLSNISLAELGPADKPSTREADKTEELSLANISLAELGPANEASTHGGDETAELSPSRVVLAQQRHASELSPHASDKTEELSLSSFSLAEQRAPDAYAARPAPGPAARTSVAHDDTTEELAGVVLPKRRSPIVWLALAALPVALGAGWFAMRAADKPAATLAPKPAPVAADVTSAHGPEGEAHAAPGAVPARSVPEAPQPSPADVTPTSEPSAEQAEERVADQATQPIAEPVAERKADDSGDEAANEEAGDDDPELDAKHKVAAARARELVHEANALRKGKKYGPAKARYREALKVYPAYPRALAGLVQLAISQHEGKQAITYAKQLVRARPGQVSNLVLLGDAYKAAGKTKDAREAWQTAARKGSATARARLKH